jgi:DMSO/TMAO reductase YedYZ heme-binding membrane subunit
VYWLGDLWVIVIFGLGHRLSLASAYVAVIYLAISLALGPYRIWRKLPNPISFDLRRDIGIWVGLLAILHTAVGLTVHLVDFVEPWMDTNARSISSADSGGGAVLRDCFTR